MADETPNTQTVNMNNTSTFRSIGAGTCGEVFTAPGSDTVHKVALTTDGQLNREYNTHKHLQACFEKHPAVRSEVLMTRVLGFVGSAGGAPNEKEEENSDDEKQKKREDKDSASWGQNAANLFPSTINTPAPVLSTTLIHPLPSLIRRQLITFYCPFVLKRQATHADENRDCLIRLYLGRRRTQSPSRAALRDYQRSPQFFNLRNYSLHLDQMEELGLSVEMYARGMGAALAVMHWEGGVDGEDVEFVLGSAPTPLPSTVSSPSALSARPSTTSQPQSQQTHLFLLDFDKVKEISFDRDGVYQAVKAFYRNDPYYPRPLASTTYAQTVWETFKTRYLAVSEEIVAKSGDQIKALPQLFIDGLVEERRRRVERFERLRAEAEGSLSEYEKLLARKEGERWNAAQINFGDLERLVWG
ncbi:hypothetical protein K490DRAFT_54961 [Saccharata proteae CBS 121410]|uniref:DUF3669 domain-containing protein n=1 Tax=Saccharata proteae CBS 121410 TaxID=1314787 RepID=A0A6A5YCY4_9PEZI|nr:hypothetical protein K490DRAFT_54961 [Saccharata proteae CBS 121410]